MLAGSESAGGVVSRTVIVKEPKPTLLCESMALHCTVVTPSANVEPEAGKHVTGTGPSWSSLAVAVYVTTAPFGPVASAVIFAGSESTGGVESSLMMTKNDADPKLKLAS